MHHTRRQPSTHQEKHTLVKAHSECKDHREGSNKIHCTQNQKEGLYCLLWEESKEEGSEFEQIGRGQFI